MNNRLDWPNENLCESAENFQFYHYEKTQRTDCNLLNEIRLCPVINSCPAIKSCPIINSLPVYNQSVVQESTDKPSCRYAQANSFHQTQPSSQLTQNYQQNFVHQSYGPYSAVQNPQEFQQNPQIYPQQFYQNSSQPLNNWISNTNYHNPYNTADFYPVANPTFYPLCQGSQPWNYAHCYGYSGEDPCQFTNVVDMEDFM